MRKTIRSKAGIIINNKNRMKNIIELNWIDDDDDDEDCEFCCWKKSTWKEHIKIKTWFL